jgi:hypothetical protein
MNKKCQIPDAFLDYGTDSFKHSEREKFLLLFM